MVQLEIELTNRLGLHARAAAKFVHTAGRFASQVQVRNNEDEVNGKSILGLLLLAAPCGTRLTLRVNGPDEDEALKALEALIVDKFGEGE
jgi:phosphocarrier protein HPr